MKHKVLRVRLHEDVIAHLNKLVVQHNTTATAIIKQLILNTAEAGKGEENEEFTPER